MPGGSPYSISKIAAKGFADCLRLETLGTGVTVHLAMPPFVDTPMVAETSRDEFYVRSFTLAQICPDLSPVQLPSLLFVLQPPWL